jgi:hypothetical protein
MKKQLLLLGASLLSIASIAQVANGDFENWTVNYLYDAPTPWVTSVSDSRGELSNTFQSPDAQDLLSSIRMETVDMFGDTNFGYAVLGEIGDNGPENGIPYTEVNLPDSLIFWAKYDIQATDSTTVIFAMTSMGSPSGMDTYKFIGTQNTWIRKAYKISPTLAADSVVIAFACSDVFNDVYIPGSWLMIDNIQVKTTAGGIWTPPNHSFETWDAISIEQADDWYSSNLFYNGDTSFFKTSDAYSNSFAAELRTIQSGSDTSVGFLSNGPSANGSWFTGVPYSGNAVSLDLFYKYAPNGSDNASVQLDFMQGDSSIGGGYVSISSAAGTYTALSVPLNVYGPGVVDSMRILITSGNNPGSVLLVDSIKLVEPTVGTQELLSINSLKHYPNPVQDELNVTYNLKESSANGVITIFDINGKIVLSQNIVTNQGRNFTKVNTSNFTKGVYTYTVNINGKTKTEKFIK